MLGFTRNRGGSLGPKEMDKSGLKLPVSKTDIRGQAFLRVGVCDQSITDADGEVACGCCAAREQLETRLREVNIDEHDSRAFDEPS